ncbi:hypothetical protein GIB67_004180 [Kingdonia uniflora]|uniref:Uncharacterized protein n=1 Tax=Kingdonia uniflora TaxID=39325 RepID=A0A7J7LLV2_9MAGN|nr:hypothetical protein GIB67_004180 [Kingdonia uniflora]
MIQKTRTLPTMIVMVIALQKLTQAQRKRVRRKKFKEAASCCHRKIIGSSMDDHENNDKYVNIQEDSTPKIPTMMFDAPMLVLTFQMSPRVYTTQNKLKQRRITKRLNRDSAGRQPYVENCHQDYLP